MKTLILLIGLLPASSFAAPEFWNRIEKQASPAAFSLYADDKAFDESLNFQPGLNLYQEAAQLTDLYGAHGSQLCAPIAVTHGMTYLKYAFQPAFQDLRPIADMDHDGTQDTYRDKIRYFFNLCQTDKETGTLYSHAIDCMREYMKISGYQPYSYEIGPHSFEAPPGYPIETTKHVLKVDDIRAYVGHRLLVLMGVGWYHYDAATKAYVREGGHFFNVYGYDYSYGWGNDKIVLKAVNSWVDYNGRAREQMYDDVVMSHVPANSGFPAETAFELRGNGFNFSQKALVEDIFVALPVK